MVEFKAQVVGWVTPSHEEAAVTRPLCYSTPQPLYQGTGKAKRTKQEASLANCSTKSHLWSTRWGVQASKKTLPLFHLYSRLKLTCVMCLFLFVGTQSLYCGSFQLMVSIVISLQKYSPSVGSYIKNSKMHLTKNSRV